MMRIQSTRTLILLTLCAGVTVGASAKKFKGKDSRELRNEYVARLQQDYVPSNESHTVGSLWSDQAVLNDMSSDYKAHRLNDMVTIQIAVRTTAAQSGSVDSERTFSTSSAVTGVMGRVPVKTNPLLAANSASALKGQGSTASDTAFQTNLTGTVVAVLPNGNMVVEAERKIFMNNQHENIIVRGVVRPGDIGPGNVVASTALSNLEIEMKGKGIISDGVRPPNPLVKAILWLLNF